MAITECGKGHVYDSDQYASCPYCNGGAKMIDFDSGMGGNSTAGVGRTVSLNESLPESGKTVAPEAYRKRREQENKTVGVFQKTHAYDPVVGWLVCVEGPEKGKDYHLWARINIIGRSERSDVCIHADDTISRENHARLAYDPKHNSFQLIPGDSTNNIYLNEEPIYTPAKLSAYDVIELGNSKFVFAPFCGERFKWPVTGAQSDGGSGKEAR